MSKGRPTITFRLPYELLNWINGMAKDRKMTVSDFIRELLEKEKERYDKEDQ